jgi:hypothetical protein
MSSSDANGMLDRDDVIIIVGSLVLGLNSGTSILVLYLKAKLRCTISLKEIKQMKRH